MNRNIPIYVANKMANTSAFMSLYNYVSHNIKVHIRTYVAIDGQMMKVVMVKILAS